MNELAPLVLGLVGTALGIWNLIASLRDRRRTTFINTVTSQRVLWIEQLRQDISTFTGLTHTWTRTSVDDAEKMSMLKEIDRLRYVIRLRLNPNGTLDRAIEHLIQKIPDLTDDSQSEELSKALNELMEQTQLLLKEEWEKVKQEAKDGDLGEKQNEPSLRTP